MVSMKKYAGSQFLKLETLGDGERVETIAGIIEASAATYDKPILVFKSGARMSLNKTNTSALCRDLGEDSEDWIEKEVRIYVGRVKFQGGLQDGLLIEALDPISPPRKLQKKPLAAPRPKPDYDDEIPL